MNTHCRTVVVLKLALILGAACAGATVTAQVVQDPQQTVEQLRRDQDEILRKAGHLRDLMTRLEQRYQRENKQEQVDLLRQGLEHLDRAGLLQDVASIRDDLAASALSDAVRKQQDVVQDIERLLNILLQRRSIENIEQEIAKTGELAGRIRDLERQQARLQDQTQSASEREPNADERQLQEQLQQLVRDQMAEAQRNARAAGTRRPFLEDALRKVRELLGQQNQLEQRAAAERSGQTDAERERMFDLGELVEQARALSTDLRDQGRKVDLAQLADQLDQALQNGDHSGAQQAHDKMEELLQRAPNRPDHPASPERRQSGKDSDQDWQQLRAAAAKAPGGATPAERDELRQLAATAREVATAREGIDRQENTAAADHLTAASKQLAERLDQADPRSPAERKPDDATPAAAVRAAADELEQAGKSAAAGAADKAQEHAQKALRQLEEARTRQRDQNPDAARIADRMAAGADAAERELRNAPSAEDAERQAADALQRAEQALRDSADRLGRADERAGAPPEQLQPSREALQQAKDTLEQALQQAGADRSAEMTAGAERQRELRERAKQVQQQLQQATDQGALEPAQQQAAQQQMQQADSAMQAAADALQRGEQSNASQQQQSAAQALQRAQQALQQNRKPGAAQQQAMRDLAQQEQQIEDEILRLAEEAKERKNPEARAALDEAADAARKARQAMQQADPQEADQQQQRAREKLDEAAQQLEEQRDRYQDMRQEELMFRMKEELLAFLDKQQPITAETESLQKAAGNDGLSRAARRKLNQFGEEEQGLAGRVQTLVQALTEEGNLVYRTVLTANHDDLTEVARRLAGRNPDSSNYTTMLQRDVERRTKELLEALAREQKRREQQRQQQQQQQDKGQNRFNPQREKLVSLIADLEMLKQLENDTRRAADDLRTLVELRTGDGVNDAEVALVERLTHRHGEVTKLFQQIKNGIEEALKSMQEQGDAQDGEPGHGRGK